MRLIFGTIFFTFLCGCGKVKPLTLAHQSNERESNPTQSDSFWPPTLESHPSPTPSPIATPLPSASPSPITSPTPTPVSSPVVVPSPNPTPSPVTSPGPTPIPSPSSSPLPTQYTIAPMAFPFEFRVVTSVISSAASSDRTFVLESDLDAFLSSKNHWLTLQAVKGHCTQIGFIIGVIKKGAGSYSPGKDGGFSGEYVEFPCKTSENSCYKGTFLMPKSAPIRVNLMKQVFSSLNKLQTTANGYQLIMDWKYSKNEAPTDCGAEDALGYARRSGAWYEGYLEEQVP